MKSSEERLKALGERIKHGTVKVAIFGLGSVGNYLLDYLLSTGDENLDIYAVGRNEEKLQSDVNIARVSSLIRGQNRSKVSVVGNVDFDDAASIEGCISEIDPDIIVNSSRAYSGLKYGSISWNNIRAYGIWSPLSIRYIRNIMAACDKTNSNAVVINTSYSDAVIPWLKSSGVAYPDFGSGNLNHLIPRIRYAVAALNGISDYWNIDVTLATAHFHDVVISKEGQTEGVDPLLYIEYNGRPVNCAKKDVFSLCRIPMPVDAKRNMMNASSNFAIINALIGAVRNMEKVKLHCPGVFGEIGGYPVTVDGTGKQLCMYMNTERFSAEDMRAVNARSLYLDGIERIADGKLYYTDELIAKVKKAFGVDLMKSVAFGEIDSAAEFLIREIITPQLKK